MSASKRISLSSQFRANFLMGEILREAAQVTGLDNQIVCLAQHLFQSYVYKTGLKKEDFRILSLSCLLLASKVVDNGSRFSLDKLIVMYYMIYQIKAMLMDRANLPQDSKPFKAIKRRVLRGEMLILRSVGFEVYSFRNTAHIYLMYLYKQLSLDNWILKTAWVLLNQLHSSWLVVCFPPILLSMAVISILFDQKRKFILKNQNETPNLLLKLEGKKENPTQNEIKEDKFEWGEPKAPWWLLFEVKIEELEKVKLGIKGFIEIKSSAMSIKEFGQIMKKLEWDWEKDMSYLKKIEKGAEYKISKISNQIKESKETERKKKNKEGKKKKKEEKKKKSKKKKSKKRDRSRSKNRREKDSNRKLSSSLDSLDLGKSEIYDQESSSLEKKQREKSHKKKHKKNSKKRKRDRSPDKLKKSSKDFKNIKKNQKNRRDKKEERKRDNKTTFEKNKNGKSNVESQIRKDQNVKEKNRSSQEYKKKEKFKHMENDKNNIKRSTKNKKKNKKVKDNKQEKTNPKSKKDSKLGKRSDSKFKKGNCFQYILILNLFILIN